MIFPEFSNMKIIDEIIQCEKLKLLKGYLINIVKDGHKTILYFCIKHKDIGNKKKN